MRAWSIAVAAVLGVTLATTPLLVASHAARAVGIGIVGLACAAAAIALHRRALAHASVVLLAGAYVVALHAAHVGLDVFAPPIGFGLFLFSEALDVAADVADVAPIESPALRGRLALTGAIASTGSAVALVALLGRSILGGAVAGLVVGAACVLGLVSLPLWLAQRDAEPYG